MPGAKLKQPLFSSVLTYLCAAVLLGLQLRVKNRHWCGEIKYPKKRNSVMRPSFLTITIMTVKLDRWLREYNDHNPNCASNNNDDKKRPAVLTCIISRSATRQACFAKGKVHFLQADTDRQLVSDPRQRAAVSPLNFSGSRL